MCLEIWLIFQLYFKSGKYALKQNLNGFINI